MRDFDTFNEVYESYVRNAFPARTCIAVTGLAGGADVEIDMVAYKKM
jgi:2-iminobutanoate/2-iminopropanoate deaminase